MFTIRSRAPSSLNNNPLVALRITVVASLKLFFSAVLLLSNLASSIPNLVARLISSFSPLYFKLHPGSSKLSTNRRHRFVTSFALLRSLR